MKKFKDMTDGEWRETCEQLAGIHFCLRVHHDHDPIEDLDQLLITALVNDPFSALSQTIMDFQMKIKAPPEQREDYLSQFEYEWLMKIDKFKNGNPDKITYKELLKQFKEGL